VVTLRLPDPFGEALLLRSGEVSGKILTSFSKAPAQLADMQEPHALAQPESEEKILQVLVRDNNVEQALRVLKKKVQREGVFREMRRRASTRNHPRKLRGRNPMRYDACASSRASR
jgi:ribosomal protein S21